MKSKELSTDSIGVGEIDWYEFDSDNPHFERILQNLSSPDEMKGVSSKNWIVPGLVASDEFVIVYGKPGTGKSVLVTDIAVKLAAGINCDGAATDFLHNVLYIAAERPGQIARRCEAFEKHHDCSTSEALRIYRGAIDISRPSDDLTAIIKTAEMSFEAGAQQDISLVIIDTLAAAMTLPDSDTGATAAAVGNILRAIRETGVAVIAISHMPLSGEQRVRGGHFEGAADTTIHVSKRGKIHSAKVVKNNDSDDRPELHYRMESVVVGRDNLGADVSAPVLIPLESPAENILETPRISKSAREALAALSSLADHAPVSEADWRAACDAVAGGITAASKKKRFDRSKKSLIESGKVIEDNGLYKIPDSGQDKDKTGQMS